MVDGHDEGEDEIGAKAKKEDSDAGNDVELEMSECLKKKAKLTLFEKIKPANPMADPRGTVIEKT